MLPGFLARGARLAERGEAAFSDARRPVPGHREDPGFPPPLAVRLHRALLGPESIQPRRHRFRIHPGARSAWTGSPWASRGPRRAHGTRWVSGRAL